MTWGKYMAANWSLTLDSSPLSETLFYLSLSLQLPQHSDAIKHMTFIISPVSSDFLSVAEFVCVTYYNLPQNKNSASQVPVPFTKPLPTPSPRPAPQTYIVSIPLPCCVFPLVWFANVGRVAREDKALWGGVRIQFLESVRNTHVDINVWLLIIALCPQAAFCPFGP